MAGNADTSALPQKLWTLRSFETPDILTWLAHRACTAWKSSTSSLRITFSRLRYSRCDRACFSSTGTMSTSCRQSSMRRWRKCTFLTRYRAHRPYSGTSRFFHYHRFSHRKSVSTDFEKNLRISDFAIEGSCWSRPSRAKKFARS